jgi:hypothetical protein
MKKIAIFAFKGDPMCFIHVFLNAIDLYSKDVDVKIIIEGEATRLIPEMEKNDHFLHGLYIKSKENGLIHKVCRACSAKMGVLQQVIDAGLPIGDDMNGHPGFYEYIHNNFEIITM